MKPVVHYDQVISHLIVGQVAFLTRTWDHPGPNVGNAGSTVMTSPLVRVGEDGEFETLNSIYRRQHAA
jgi:hypothetical protein